MAELKRETRTAIDISSEIEVLSYTWAGDLPIEIVARIDIGDVTNPISGVGGLYLALLYLDGASVVPLGETPVPAGRTRVIVVSRPVPLEPGDVISLRIQGLAGDTVVNTVATIRNVTPASTAEVLGDGPIEVDHNYGGANALSYYVVSTSQGIAGADIRVFFKSDYDAGNRGNDFVVARTSTGTGGRWTRAVMLDPGVYTLLYYKVGAYGPTTAEITVA